MESYTLVAKTLAGLEDVLAKEIKEIGGKNIVAARRAIIFEGDKKMMYRANYNLRTALRILKQVGAFNFKNVDDFYTRCREINWTSLMDSKNTFAVFSTVYNSKDFRNSMFASLKVKDAIVDRFRQKLGKRPNIDTEKPEFIINVHVSGDNCTLSLDSSGESLYKRGYKVGHTQAPLNEVLAAGMILLSGWKGDCDFIDPMCGSGTLPIEAALLATNTPPGVFRKEFGFEKWPDYDDELLTDVAEESDPVPLKIKIFASDISARNLAVAKANARNAGISKYIDFNVCDFKDLAVKANGATLMINPPYGERMKSEELENLYGMIGERLKHQYPGNRAWILSSSKNLFKKIGLKYSERLELYNGSIKCDYRKYDLFEGKRKLK